MKTNSETPDRIDFPPSVMLYPLPVVMVSCAGNQSDYEEDRANIVTVAWAGTVCSDPPMISISLRKSRHSHRLISDTKELVVNLVSQSLVHSCDYCGVRSGQTEDKFASCHLTAVPASGLKHAPAILEAPIYLSCIVEKTIELGSHDMFIARIISVSVDQRIVGADGKIRIDNADLVTYVHGDYYSIGKMLGFFGYSVASADKLRKRMKNAIFVAKSTTKKISKKKKPRK
ncbi:MAG: flavin reductase family protein [Clostridiaceae bacterium]|nr:flavin reductase family protein [Clostridiaceae bacterium]